MRLRVRPLALLLALCMLLQLCGCALAGQPEEQGNQVSLYYELRDSEDLKSAEVISAEVRVLDVLSMMDFFALYFKGPESDALTSPFPPHTGVQDIRYTGDVLTLTMSDEYFSLIGVNLVLANCCIAKTVESYTGRDQVLITDESGATRYQVSTDLFLLSNTISGEMNTAYTFYFADQDRRYLIQETRNAVLSQNETPEAFLMRTLLEGPDNDLLQPVIPEGTVLRSISVAETVCTLDLSSSFLTGRSGDFHDDYLTIYGITDTLTAIDGIEAVRFLCEGETIPYYGVFPLDMPVLRNTDCIGPVRAANGELDVDLYLFADATGAPQTMPCRMRQSISEPLVEAVVRTLLQCEPPPGLHNPIPSGTELLSVVMSGSVCHVDLSDKLIPQEDTEAAEREILWSLVMTLTELDEVTAVLLTVEGERDAMRYVDLSSPLTRQNVSMD